MNHENRCHTMMNRLFIGATVFAVLYMAGCAHYRHSAISTVEGGIQKVATRNRYTLMGTKFSNQSSHADVAQENLYSRTFTNSELKGFQPDVFADNGIPFVLGGKSSGNYSRSYGWTMYFPFLSTLCALPQCLTCELPRGITVDVIDNPDARTSFDMCYRYDMAMSFTPASLLFYAGDASMPDGMKTGSVVSRHSVQSFSGGYKNMDVSQEMLAYSIAASLKRMEDEGLISELRGGRANRPAATESSVAGKFDIVDFRKQDDTDHRYLFTVRLRGGKGVSLRESRELQKSLRAVIREDYVASFPDADAGALVVDFPEFSSRNGEVKGVAAVLSFSIASLKYDQNTRTGCIRLRIGENQFEDARRYARKNIELLVRDKNIALDARDIPPAATFYIRGETLKGDILEITFKTE